MEKHTSFFSFFVNGGKKLFYAADTWANVIKLLTDVIYKFS